MASTNGLAPAGDVATIRFDRTKYGARLLVDACDIRAIPSFITTPLPHRLTFYEIALITEGSGTLELDGSPLDVAPGRVCITAPGEVRRWRLEGARVGGMLAFFEAAFLNEFFADAAFVERLPVMAGAATARGMALARRPFDELAEIMHAMQDEFRAVQPDSAHALRAQIYRLLVALQRQAGPRVPEPEGRAHALARRFARLVDEHYRRNERVAGYARMLGVSARHLNHCVQEASGQSAGTAIQQRLQLEAQRLLMHTDTSVVDIAQALSFSDASYFARFFKRHAGMSPREFRAMHESPGLSPQRPLRRPHA